MRDFRKPSVGFFPRCWRRIFICLGTAGLTLGAALPVDDGISGERLARVSHFAEQYVDEESLPFVVYGVQRRGAAPRIATVGDVDAAAIFRIFSMSKPVTVVAVLMLFEQGHFLLSDPLARYLPEFAEMQVWVEEGKLRPARGPITIEHLLTHTSGLSYADNAAGVPSIYAQSDHWKAESLAQFSERIARLPLAFEPGERWHYSVANDVLGRLVEVVAGVPFDAFVEERILDPLGMTDTGFTISEEQRPRLVPLYQKDGESMKLITAGADSALLNPKTVPYGGQGLVSTLRDYLRFSQMLMNDGQLDGVRLLSRKTVDLMMSDHLSAFQATQRLNEPWIANTENRTGDLDLGLGYGYGGYVIANVAQNAVPGTAGTYAWGGGSNTYFFIDREEQLIGVFLTQLTPSGTYPLRSQFRGLVYQAISD